MDINAIIKIVKDIPKDKWTDEKTIKATLKKAGKTSGKNFTEAELNKYAQQFKQLAASRSPLTLISMLLKSGISMEQINEIQKKMRSK
ncbi:hypothetical protein [Aneurinibacillus aneurinilyticus]|jgi:hypothetical protein|uniref:Uncharacterized protein n=2 Tax=Aneurinibacillus aneurinilyticus TaxID=1391 RepID=A0A848CVD6_ANEAE|nr:hypothetical protein [Aneurinibacillus aneurinilyticus]ERI10346.1 hypothetical protein HMPREF0083_01567 [Aneurinibacillus aneurinilyticus ATCC 12856]MCI1696415.1 hypothetical protein [Aneurinibacillus aneurinilyticus]MED0669028.1 hypothetical protein [Aneurinibacillus aneurinilyticus]MED0707647.1 hypothetical protein [Aneurinibacillus aneurinilyticus]MED0725976.1 hypothetical protein [Aneurinibacillus aneurinilyticus]